MEVVLGRYLDGQRACLPGRDLDRIVMGPSALLGYLESQLGLVAPPVSHSRRIAQYLGALRAADNGRRFYSASLAVDALASAAELLHWRDELRMAGWTGEAGDGSVQRIADLAAAERDAGELVRQGIPDRVSACVVELERQALTGVQLTLVDPVTAFPEVLRHLLNCFPLGSAEMQPRGAVPGSDLRSLQMALHSIAQGRMPAAIFQGDGSLRVVSAPSSESAQYLAAAEFDAHGASLLLLASEGAERLDARQPAMTRPCLGVAAQAPVDPGLQFLPLALDLLWKPVRVASIIGFLQHPLCPLAADLRYWLSCAVADQPGLGGEAWRRAMERACEGSSNPDALKDSVARWILVQELADGSNADMDVLIRRVGQIRQALVACRQTAAGDNELADTALAHANNFLETIGLMQSAGEATLSRQQLERLVLLSAQGAAGRSSTAQLGAPGLATCAGAVIEPVARLLWWQPKAEREARLRWTDSELAALRAIGARYPSYAERGAQTRREWVRAVSMVTDQLTIVLPPNPDEAHPVWPFCRALFKDSLQALRADAVLDGPETLPARRLPLLPLPAKRRWWQLPEALVLERRHKESASSIAKLIDAPHAWVLQYAAKLERADTVSIADGALLLGNLAHRLVEWLSPRWLEMNSPAALEAWFRETLPVLLEQEGAVLLEPGRYTDMADLRQTLWKMLQELKRHIDALNPARVTAEKEVNATVPGIGRIGGRIDLIAEFGAEQLAVLDLKWGREGDRRKELQQARQIQLATYWALCRHGMNANVEPAYFIVARARLLAPSQDVFREASVAGAAESTADIWRRVAASWTWRRAQLDAGRIEVVSAATEGSEASEPPEDALAAVNADDPYSDYLHLLGWREPDAEA